MIKLSHLLLSEGRSKIITHTEFTDILNEHCKNYSRNNTKIYRGIEDSFDNNQKYRLIDPSKSKRILHTSSKLYTDFLNTSKQWKDFPKRDESVICSTYKKWAEKFGELYEVIPFDNAKIGICSVFDIWGAFDNSKIDISELDYWFNSINIIINKLLNKTPKTIRELLKLLDTIPKNDIIEIIKNNKKLEYLTESINTLYRYKKKEDCFEKIFNTSKFQLKLYTKNFKTANICEVWTDSKCLLININ